MSAIQMLLMELDREARATRRVLERVTIAHVVSGKLPGNVRSLLDDPDALISH